MTTDAERSISSYTCPKCGSTSRNPNDALNRYCGRCHQFEADMAPEEIPTVLRIVGLAGARPSPFDGQWLVEYDPTRPGTDPNGVPILAHLVTTPDRSKALRLGGLAAAHALWTKESGHTRPDGRRDRPLCAFDVVVERYHLPADEAAS